MNAAWGDPTKPGALLDGAPARLHALAELNINDALIYPRLRHHSLTVLDTGLQLENTNYAAPFWSSILGVF